MISYHYYHHISLFLLSVRLYPASASPLPASQSTSDWYSFSHNPPLPSNPISDPNSPFIIPEGGHIDIYPPPDSIYTSQLSLSTYSSIIDGYETSTITYISTDFITSTRIHSISIPVITATESAVHTVKEVLDEANISILSNTEINDKRTIDIPQDYPSRPPPPAIPTIDVHHHTMLHSDITTINIAPGTVTAMATITSTNIRTHTAPTPSITITVTNSNDFPPLSYLSTTLYTNIWDLYEATATAGWHHNATHGYVEDDEGYSGGGKNVTHQDYEFIVSSVKNGTEEEGEGEYPPTPPYKVDVVVSTRTIS